MKITLQPSGENLLKGKARDVGALSEAFDETTKLNPPDLAKLSDSRKLAVLRELHSRKRMTEMPPCAGNALRSQVAGRGAGD